MIISENFSVLRSDNTMLISKNFPVLGLLITFKNFAFTAPMFYWLVESRFILSRTSTVNSKVENFFKWNEIEYAYRKKVNDFSSSIYAIFTKNYVNYICEFNR